MKLTKPQRLIDDLEKYAGGSIAVICGSILTRGEQSVDVLKKAVKTLFEINDALRIRISEENGVTEQVITETTKTETEVLSFGSRSELRSYAESYAKVPLDYYGELCEMKVVMLPGACGILAKLHHIIGDAWTLSLLGKQLDEILNGGTPAAFSYTDYCESEEKYLRSKRYGGDRDFFLEQYRRCPEVTYLSESHSASFAAARKTVVVEKKQAKRISDYVHEKDTSFFMLFATVTAAYISRVKRNAERFFIGTTVLNRSGFKEKNTAGMFINTVPMLMELQNEKSFAENLSETENTAFSVFRHQRYNYRDVLTDIREQFGFQEKLYDVVLSYQNANIGDTGYETTWYHCGMQTEHLQIHIEDRDNEGKFRIHYDYLCDCFSEKEIGLLHRHLMNLLFSAIEDDSKKLYEPEMLTEEEKQKLLIDFNDTAVDYPREKSVSQLFEEQVKENPGKVAIIDKNRTLTYKALSQQVDRYCATLQLFGVRKGAVVAIHLDRSYEITVFQLAVIKAGAVFLPVDKRYPLQRIKYMCDDCNVFMMISDSLQGIKTVNVISLEKFKLSITSCPTKTIYNDICYIIYTSGSTG